MSRNPFLKATDVRWCPGCGDYAILKYLADALFEQGLSPADVTVIAGIGCSSRLPYYLTTYGFHTIHGRALSIATGIAIAQPNRPLIVITGDGDSCSIGLSHLIHTVRRNVNMMVLLVNNRVYGLTKGQASPTSLPHQKTKSSSKSVEGEPISPLSLVLAGKGTWIGRCLDTDASLMKSLIKNGLAHEGTSVLEILQHCPVFDRSGYSDLIEKNEQALTLWPGKPIVCEIDTGKQSDAFSAYARLLDIDVAHDSLYAGTRMQAWSLLEEMTGEYLIKGLIYQENMEKFLHQKTSSDRSNSCERAYDRAWNSLLSWSR